MVKKELRKPRLRKTAPSIRERAEVAQAQKAQSPKGPIRAIAGKALSKLRLPKNRLTKPLFKFAVLLKRLLLWITPSYFINSWHELKQVTWPGRIETWRLTLAVFIFAIAFGIAIGAVDKVLNEVFKKLILN